MGEDAGPVMIPAGVRAGVSNGDRALVGVVPSPGTVDGSGCGATGCVVCAPSGSFSRRTPPAATAAPVIRARRVTRASSLVPRPSLIGLLRDGPASVQERSHGRDWAASTPAAAG